jgi:hypothetical protein
MDARLLRAALVVALFASLGAGYKTPNFVVTASTEALAERVGRAAEKYRRELAIEWVGKEMPDWSEPCPITVQCAPHLGAGGETSFVFDRGEVFGWRMRVQGNEQRILDSVLPHEVTHTILATHFRRPLPRWADEGACTTVEHIAEKKKQQNMLITFLKTNKGISFSQMFAMKDYPPDVLPLYAQGYSLARFLIDQGGRRKFVNFIGDGLRREDWTGAVTRHYGYTSLGQLQDKWLNWVKQGSPVLEQLSPLNKETAIAQNDTKRARFQSDDTTAAEPRTVATASSFDREGDWKGPFGLTDASDARAESALDNALAYHDERPARVEVNRANKRSVYERDIEPSGNLNQYPFDGRRLEASGRVRPVTSESERGAAGRVILEWSRDNREPLADAAW